MSTPTVDFLSSRTVPRHGWIVLAVGVLALAVTQQIDQHWVAERNKAEQAHAAKLKAMRSAQKPAAPNIPITSVRRVQYAQAQMQRPWLATLRAIESAAVDPIYLLSISFGPTQGTIKLEAEAPSFDRAVAFTQALSDSRAFAYATLSSHEQKVDSNVVGPTVRFTVEARWSPP